MLVLLLNLGGLTMTQEKVQSLINSARKLKSYLVIVTKTQLRLYIDFDKKYNKSTHTDKMFIYYWNVVFHRWNILPLEDIDFIEFH